MSVTKYLAVFRLGLHQAVSYRHDFWMSVLSRVIGFAGLALFWYLVGRNTLLNVSFKPLFIYFLIANSFSELIDGRAFRFGRFINDHVYQGSLSSVLLKPVNPVAYLFLLFQGSRAITQILSLIFFITGLLMALPLNFHTFGLFLLISLMALSVSSSINVIIGSLSFWITEADGIQNTISHIARVFGGSLIPITFMMGNIKTLVLLSPFPLLSYIPAITILSQPADINLNLYLVVSLVWMLLLFFISTFFFRLGLKKYEAIGI